MGPPQEAPCGETLDNVNRYRDSLLVGRVAHVTLVGAIAFAVMALANALLGVSLAALVDVSAAVALVVGRRRVLRAESDTHVRRLASMILAVPVVVIVLLDSFQPGNNVYWLGCVPLAAAWFLDEKATIHWTGVTIAAVIVTSIAIAFNINGEDVAPAVALGNMAYLGVFMGTVGAIAVAARRVLERHVAEVERHRVQAEKAKTDLEVLNDQLADRVRERTLRLEQALEDVRTTARAKAVLMSNLTHEFRTPLNGIMGASALLADSELSGEQRDLVEALRGSVGALRSILEGILDCVGIESGALQLADTAFDPGAVVESVVSEHTHAATDKGLALETLCHPSTPHTVRGDPVRVREILNCLVDNAVKFTDAGHVVVSSRWVDGEGLHISVEDTGCGFDVRYKDELFALMLQGDSGMTRAYQGLGVGLGLVRRLVDLMGGDIDVDSDVGAGSRFEVILPLENPQFEEGAAVCLAGCRVHVVAAEPWGALLEAGVRERGAEVTVSDSEPVNWDFDVMLLHESVSDAERAAIVMRSGERPIVACRAPLNWRDLLERLCSACDSSQPSGSSSTTSEKREGSWVVLVVEDNILNQKVLKAMLERDGCEVVLASDGRQGVQAYEARIDSVEVVLMDCQMPVLDGYGATREIRAIESARGQKHVPIVAVTANAGPDDREKCLAAGMDEYVAKPVTPDELGEVLGRLDLAFESRPDVRQPEG